MKQLQQKLLNKQDLSQQEAYRIFCELIQGKLSEIEMTSLLVALKMKGEQPQEIAGAALALRENAIKLPPTDYLTADSCGTGGSGMNTVNISTMVAIVLAEMGLPMAKHGNRSVSSKCGSADVLEKLGVKIDMTQMEAKKCLDQLNFCFLFAPAFHPGVKHVMLVRKQLQTRTIFNMLGPLINPAEPKLQLMGVYANELCQPAAQTLKLAGCQSAMVVHSGGYDEITLHSKTQVSELKNQQISNYQLDHTDFDLPACNAEDITGNDPEENAAIFVKVLKGDINDDKLTAIANTVAANAAALLTLSNKASDLKSAAAEVLVVIRSGKAYQRLTQIIEFSHTINKGLNS